MSRVTSWLKIFNFKHIVNLFLEKHTIKSAITIETATIATIIRSVKAIYFHRLRFKTQPETPHDIEAMPSTWFNLAFIFYHIFHLFVEDMFGFQQRNNPRVYISQVLKMETCI